MNLRSHTENSCQNTSYATILSGILLSACAVAIIYLTSDHLSRFDLVGKTKPFAYPWRLREPSTMARVTAWLGYCLHNLFSWVMIWLAKRRYEHFSSRMRGLNWCFLAGHILFFIAHYIQTHIWYDGLASDVPEVTALGSVALMLIVVLLLETPRRGLFWGHGKRLPKQMWITLKKYHGYLFTWALTYTFWYHPTASSPGHLIGFFYLLILLWQSALIFHEFHRNRYWIILLEIMVIPHAVIVAYYQGNQLWPMFLFGFSMVFVITQMHTFKMIPILKISVAISFALVAFGTYSYLGRLEQLHEIMRIPLLDYSIAGLIILAFFFFSPGRRPQIPAS